MPREGDAMGTAPRRSGDDAAPCLDARDIGKSHRFWIAMIGFRHVGLRSHGL